jgi:predicted phage tail protein
MAMCLGCVSVIEGTKGSERAGLEGWTSLVQALVGTSMILCGICYNIASQRRLAHHPETSEENQRRVVDDDDNKI